MSKELYTANNKRIAKNTLYLYLRMLLTMGVSLYTSRIVLNALGIVDFGIYNIVGGVVILFSFINNSLSSATQRFLNFELGKGDALETKRIFSMSLTIHICVALFVVLLAETVGLWFCRKLGLSVFCVDCLHEFCTSSLLCKCSGIRKDVFFCIYSNYRSYAKVADCVYVDLCRF